MTNTVINQLIMILINLMINRFRQWIYHDLHVERDFTGNRLDAL